MLSRSTSVNRRLAFISILVGLFIALLAGGTQYLVFHHKRTEQLDNTISELKFYLNGYFSDLMGTINTIQPLTMSRCEDVASELTSRAAFSLNIRAFLLVKEGHAFCSSATGAMDIAISDLVPSLDLSQNKAMAILPGTPMMPHRPAFILWVRSPLLADRGVFTSIDANLMPWILTPSKQNQYNGVALVINGATAISTFNHQPVPLSTIDSHPIRQAKIKGVPLEIYLYGNEVATDNMLYSLLLGSMCGLLSGILCLYVMATRLRPGREILSAIKRDQFHIVYQPVVHASDLHIGGVEVLMRWTHPVAGNIPPDAFISFAEGQNLIVPLTCHLFELIAKEAPALQKVLPPGTKLGINISPSHLHAESFRQDIRNLIASLPENYFQVVLELTERDMLNEKQAVKVFDWLHSEGVEIAIDDFGTGHSALIYLERFTLDYLKIDRGFINAIGTETVTSPVLDTVLTLTHRLNLVTVAEGVETQEQATWLRDHGVDFLQGYWISKPLTLAQLIDAHNEPAKYFTSR
ncbi:cyclic di-GMP phosphodiesterase [Pseudocitrobacter cyperus]|uniref:cyclic-guanylate-specific phosphodiesterase n=1 Tax=Pseudocitrobacter cyperus TaxID=3112843 RepID=A0ABV0HLS2_9ENTR